VDDCIEIGIVPVETYVDSEEGCGELVETTVDSKELIGIEDRISVVSDDGDPVKPATIRVEVGIVPVETDAVSEGVDIKLFEVSVASAEAC
jgi:hypothetical protein